MHLHHVAHRRFTTLTRRYPLLRHFSLTVCAVILVWVYTIHYGERGASGKSVQDCEWSNWEHWPAGATPHRLVFIADPQIVDPHTYPGRPWPLSTLTERYTDAYMYRNYRLINEKLDPDSIVFLGDLFDGGREWAPYKARSLKASQRQKLDQMGVHKPAEDKQEEKAGSPKAKREEGSSYVADEGHVEKRSLETYKGAMMRPHRQPVTKEDHNLDKRGNDLKEFVYGEKGRWRKWGAEQWNKEFQRFGKIFFDPGQLYPKAERRVFPSWDVPTHPVAVENGANEIEWEEYAIAGGKTRRLLTSLPGNHDLGFGPGVQLAVRDRFSTHFGEGNSVRVLGNHTFVSIDAPSLAAYSQFDVGGETPKEVADGRKHLWKPTMEFLDDIQSSTKRVVANALDEYYPDLELDPSYAHTVTSPSEDKIHALPTPASQPQLPIILLSHVPLYREPNTDCGSLRERGTAISISGGYQYQNTLTRGLSNTIAQKISAAGEIVHAFSGDDHDYCDVSHRYNVRGARDSSTSLKNFREITVKSFSWAMGVRKPGFLLLSLWNPVDGNGDALGTPLPTTQTHLCLLPDQLGIFISYAQLAALTLLILLIRAVVLALRSPNPSTLDSDSDSDPDTLPPLSLPRFRPAKSSANGYSTPTSTKSRQRASSTGLKPAPSPQNPHSLGVQRSMNARTRSVSPATGPLIEKAGFYPSVRWEDPADVSEDEESWIGEEGGDGKGKWRSRKEPGAVKRGWREFRGSLGALGVVAGGYYVVMVRSG